MCEFPSSAISWHVIRRDVRNTNNATTFQPYDPLEMLGR
jgi:hypothetical protein